MIKLYKKSFIFFTVLSISLTQLSGNDYVTYSGNTGILETPNGRIMPDWSMRFFLSQDKPYMYYGFAGAPLPFLEANFHMTQINGVSGFSDSAGYGDYKDKSISFKLLLKKEENILLV